MSKCLKLALLHLDIRHKQPRRNRERLLKLAARAAEKKADIILAPELAISGYSFTGPEEIAPFAETAAGPTAANLAAIAARHKTYIAFGLAEKDPVSSIFYNSALVIGPQGRIACHYRKINAESRWACPGEPVQANTFDTAWGRVGLLICSDTYHGLMPRVTALRGADLLLVPANWPPAGLDPQELWSARALENGIFLAACNRTGIDKIMDCRQAPSVACDNQGRTIAAGLGPGSRIVMVDLPLDRHGKLPSRRRERLESRRPDLYRCCYLNLAPISDPAAFFHLPAAGRLNLVCLVPAAGKSLPQTLAEEFKRRKPAAGSLCLLPAATRLERALLEQAADRWQVGICTCVAKGKNRQYWLFEPGHTRPLAGGPQTTFPWPWFDFGPARIATASADDLHHPEAALAASKQGCDLAIVLEPEIRAGHKLLAGARTIEQLAVAACGRNLAGIWQPPRGHRRWAEDLAEPGQALHLGLNTGRIRKKRFQDRIDFHTLLAGPLDRG